MPDASPGSSSSASSYLVLARKYRPQHFDDLVGQEHVARTLTNAIQLGRVHHAFLFTGARGVGKTSAARILARALCCAQGPTATPCGVCDFCREIVSGQSVDVVEIDGASNRGVEDARNLREAVRYAPSKGRKKVYIIDEVHMFTAEAFNALLKTLEEPPPHVVFILATTEVHRIPITILSRCQRYDFKLVPTPRLVDHLSAILTKEHIGFEVEGLRMLARQAAGSVRDSLSLLDQMIAYVGDAPIDHEKVVEVLGVADRRLLTSVFDAVLSRDAGLALRTLAGAIDKGIDLVQLSRAFLGFIHDVELAGLVGDASVLIDATSDEIAEARALAERAPRGLLGTLFDRWARAVDEAGRSQSARLLIEMALVDLCLLEPLLPLGDLLKRLEDLEGRLLDGGTPRSGGGGRSSTASPSSASPAPTAVPSIPRPRASAAPAVAEIPARPASPVALAAVAVGQGLAAVVASSPLPAPPPVLAPSPPPAPSPSPAASAEDGWNRLRITLQERPALAAALDHAAVETWEPGRVVLVLGDKLPLDQIEKSRKLVEEALRGVTGQETSLTLKMGAHKVVPLLRSETSREAETQAKDRRHREEEARQHPMIRKAQEVFGVSAREIKVI